MESQRRHGRCDRALNRYCRCITPILRGSIDEYQQLVVELDTLSGGKLSSRGATAKTASVGGPPVGAILLQNVEHFGKKLRIFFDDLMSLGNSKFLTRWRWVISERREYLLLLQRLIGDFGNFEATLPLLPGTGDIITNASVQRCLDQMYDINTRNLRLLELIHSMNRAWQAQPPWPNHGFFEPHTSIGQAVSAMLMEYLIHVDPVRIRQRQQAATRVGKNFTLYRFWRAAETLRLMAGVQYLDVHGQQRRPMPQRRYVPTNLARTPHMVTDIRRLEWALKEIFNNSLSATTRLYTTADGSQWVAQPLERHSGDNPDYAIFITLEFLPSTGWFGKTKLRLTIRDEGVGIDPKHLPYLGMWGYSPRREEVRQKVEQSRRAGLARVEAQIGGKGIGLAYATKVVKEHGGSLTIDSALDQGTTVAIELPVPTSLPGS